MQQNKTFTPRVRKPYDNKKSDGAAATITASRPQKPYEDRKNNYIAKNNAVKTVPYNNFKAQAAVKLLLKFIGEDEEREGLLETPARVISAFQEYFSGYRTNPKNLLQKQFEEVADYNGIITLKDIDFYSHCEHHMAPFFGKAHIAYIPEKKVVGISKLARLVEVFAKRLQIQERMTAEIASTINKCLHPKGVIVSINAKHFCITCRGVRNNSATMLTTQTTGVFKTDAQLRQEVLLSFNQGDK